MARRLSNHVQQNGTQVRQSPRAEEIGPRFRRVLESGSRDHGVGSFDLLLIETEHHLWSGVRWDIPRRRRISLRAVIDNFAGNDDAEPEALDLEGEVLYQSQAAPTTRQNDPLEIFASESLEDANDVNALTFKGVEQRALFFSHNEILA